MSWLPKQSVVVPVDFSKESLEAVVTARQLVASPEHLHVVHVLPTVEPHDMEAVWMTVDAGARGEHARQAMHERLTKLNLPDVKVHVVFGEAGHEIADFAQRQKAELVVLPSHGRTGLTRLLIGSTAERVVRLCHCPVLVLRE